MNKAVKRNLKFYLLILVGVLLILESFSAFGYSNDLNLGVVMPGIIGTAIIALALRLILIKKASSGELLISGKGFLYIISKPLGRRARIIVTTLLIILLLFFTAIEGFIILDPYLHRSELAGKVEYLIVLGCGIWPDGRPTLALKYRLDRAYSYYIANKPLKIIVSGGQGINEPIPEAEAMASYLIAKGVPRDDIMLEDRSTSTMENFKLSRLLLGDSASEPIRIVFVTNDFHVLRSRILAERNGFDAYAIPAPTPAVVILNSYLREFFAFVKSMLVDY